MRNLLLFFVLLVVSSIALEDISHGHGGVYRGPGNPGAPGDTVPAPSGPAPGSSGGSAPGPTVPGAPPSGAAPSAPSAPKGPSGPNRAPDLTLWEFWWGFNKDAYLNLKQAIYAQGTTDGDEFFLGLGRFGPRRQRLRPAEELIRHRIVPLLKNALANEHNNDIVTSALIALARIGDARGDQGASEFEGLLAGLLSDPRQELAETAAIALGILAHEHTIALLASLARDDEQGRKLTGGHEVPFRTRAFASYGLGLIGHRTASDDARRAVVEILLELLARPDAATRDLKVAAVVSMGLVPIAVDRAESPDSSTRPSSSRQNQMRALLALLRDPQQHWGVRAHAPAALTRLLPGVPRELSDELVRALLAPLERESKEPEELRQSCVLALGQVADTDQDALDVAARATLVRVAEEGELQVRNFAMIALAQIGARAGRGAGNEQGVKHVRAELVNALTKGKSHIRPWAALAIGVMERGILDHADPSRGASAEARASVRLALKECVDPDQLGAYSIALGLARDIGARELLLEKLANVSVDNTRGYIALALGLIGERASIEPIQQVIKVSKYRPELLRQAAIGLGLLGDRDLVLDFVAMLNEAHGTSSRAAIASALGFIGDARSIDPLIALFKNEEISDPPRAFAIVALGLVADKEALPWNAKISTDINYRATTQTLTGDNAGILDIL